jgi:hypothetical protein
MILASVLNNNYSQETRVPSTLRLSSDLSKLEVIVRIQYLKLGYGITEAWVPVVKTETGGTINLRFFGIDYWYFE